MFLKDGKKILKNVLFREQFLDICCRVVTWNFISLWLSGHLISAGKSMK